MIRLIILTLIVVTVWLYYLGVTPFFSLFRYSFSISIGLAGIYYVLISVIENRGGWSWSAMQRNAEGIYTQGQEAFQHGLGIDSNPYKSMDGELWLEGWLDAKELSLWQAKKSNVLCK